MAFVSLSLVGAFGVVLAASSRMHAGVIAEGGWWGCPVVPVPIVSVLVLLAAFVGVCGGGCWWPNVRRWGAGFSLFGPHCFGETVVPPLLGVVRARLDPGLKFEIGGPVLGGGPLVSLGREVSLP